MIMRTLAIVLGILSGKKLTVTENQIGKVQIKKVQKIGKVQIGKVGDGK